MGKYQTEAQRKYCERRKNLDVAIKQDRISRSTYTCLGKIINCEFNFDSAEHWMNKLEWNGIISMAIESERIYTAIQEDVRMRRYNPQTIKLVDSYQTIFEIRMEQIMKQIFESSKQDSSLNAAIWRNMQIKLTPRIAS